MPKPTHPGFWRRRAERLHIEAARRAMHAQIRLHNEALMRTAQATAQHLVQQIAAEGRSQLDTLLLH